MRHADQAHSGRSWRRPLMSYPIPPFLMKVPQHARRGAGSQSRTSPPSEEFLGATARRKHRDCGGSHSSRRTRWPQLALGHSLLVESGRLHCLVPKSLTLNVQERLPYVHALRPKPLEVSFRAEVEQSLESHSKCPFSHQSGEASMI